MKKLILILILVVTSPAYAQWGPWVCSEYACQRDTLYYPAAGTVYPGYGYGYGAGYAGYGGYGAGGYGDISLGEIITSIIPLERCQWVKIDGQKQQVCSGSRLRIGH